LHTNVFWILRDITKETGVTVDDVAKRLMDFGFHAPTMSFPVPGTLMVEPTESEDLTEINRFIAAMQQIAAEIQEVRSGVMAIEESALRHAPHTSADLLKHRMEPFIYSCSCCFPRWSGRTPYG
jgi:glycine dehydrogenase